MKWRIAVNGAVLVVAISAAGVGSAAGFDTPLSHSPQRKFVAADAKSVLSNIKVENEYKIGYKRSLFIHWADLNGRSWRGWRRQWFAQVWRFQANPWLGPYGPSDVRLAWRGLGR